MKFHKPDASRNIKKNNAEKKEEGRTVQKTIQETEGENAYLSHPTGQGTTITPSKQQKHVTRRAKRRKAETPDTTKKLPYPTTK